MGLNTAFTEENLCFLEEAIVEGTKRVKYTDKEVEYRSLAEMMQLRNIMKKELCKSSNSKTKTGLFGGRRINAIHSKGLC